MLKTGNSDAFFREKCLTKNNNYLVFYKTDDETETVYVVRIMYGGRDVHKQLSQTEDVSED